MEDALGAKNLSPLQVTEICAELWDSGIAEVLFGLGRGGQTEQWTGLILSTGLTRHQLATRLEGYAMALRLEAGE